MRYLISALVAPLVGLAASYLGLGGGFLLIPYMELVLGMDPHVTTATSLLMIFFLSSSSAIAYLRLGLVRLKVALILEAFTVPMAVLGALLNWRTAPSLVILIFGLFLLVVSGWMTLGREREGERVDLRIAASFSTLAGFVSGFLGVGGGILKVPILMFSGLRAKNAVATSSFMIMITSFSGMLTHIAVGRTDYLLAASMIPGLILGAQLGPRIASRSKGKKIRLAFAAALAFVGARMVVGAL